ncbi:hypothetical protein FCM35_KLT19319 [Carex littledalei]|uniref:F-box domain-containing protein n=1 Tax=Carex littledalei TaxID=544730 RepID=A0A833VV99_9POAL|nr:hypothetical protein FCM35_KLT19319 [Carex littledalei]
MERRDWSSLPELIVAMISNFLLSENVTEYIRFRAVCPGWRQSTAPPSKPLCRPIQQKRKRLRHVLFPSISFATAQTFYAGRFLAGTGHYRGSGSSTIFNFSRLEARWNASIPIRLHLASTTGAALDPTGDLNKDRDLPPDFSSKNSNLRQTDTCSFQSVSLCRGASASRLEVRDSTEDESEMRSEKRSDT